MDTIRSNWRWNTALSFVQALVFGASVMFGQFSFSTSVGLVAIGTLLFTVIVYENASRNNVKKAVAYAAIGNSFGGASAMCAVAALVVPENLSFWWIMAGGLFLCTIFSFIDTFRVAAKEAKEDGLPRWVGITPLLPLGLGVISGGAVILFYKNRERRKLERATLGNDGYINAGAPRQARPIEDVPSLHSVVIKHVKDGET